MIQAYKKYWKQYIDFRGKTTAYDFWWAVLVTLIINVAISALVWFVPVLNIVSYVWDIVNLIPGVALFVRRMNDCNRSWANIFWLLLPIVGWIILIVRLCERSK